MPIHVHAPTEARPRAPVARVKEVPFVPHAMQVTDYRRRPAPPTLVRAAGARQPPEPVVPATERTFVLVVTPVTHSIPRTKSAMPIHVHAAMVTPRQEQVVRPIQPQYVQAAIPVGRFNLRTNLVPQIRVPVATA